MDEQDMLTVFLALTAVAVLIQTGILVGFYLLTRKLSRQADHALDVTRDLLGPIEKAAENLQDVSVRFAELSSKVQGQVREFEQWLKRRTA